MSADNPISRAEYTSDEEEREFDLARQINKIIGGQQIDVLLNAMTRVMAAVLASVRHEDEGDMVEASLFSGVVVNLHALVHPDPSESVSGTLTIGARSDLLTPEVMDAATILCPPLHHLMTGLRLHYDGRHVANSWTSVLLNLLVEDGPEGEPGLARAQAILKDILDGLPATYAQMRALRAFDEQGNTGQVGRA